MSLDLAPHVQDIARALSNKLSPEEIEDELRKYIDYGVPLAQAKRDIIRNHGGTLRAGRRSLAELIGGEQQVDLLVKIQTVNEKEINTKDGPKKVWFGYMADETKSLQYTAWKDFSLEKSRVYEIKNAYAKTFREQPDVNLGDRTTVVASTAEVKAADGFSRAQPADAPRAGQQVEIRDLREGLNNVTVVGRIVDVEEREITVQGQPRTITKGTLADHTGSVPFTAWTPTPQLAAGAAVKITGGYVKSYKGAPDLNLGDFARVEPADNVPAADELALARRATIAEVEKTGGMVEVEGVILEVKQGSGLVFRCPECNRVLQKRECRLHGRVEGIPDLRTKAVLDDGYGALTLLIGKDGTERLLGRTLAECQNLAKEAMTTDVVEDELRAKLLARRLVARGNALKDEFGVQLIAQEAVAPSPRDTRREAEAVLEELADLGVTA